MDNPNPKRRYPWGDEFDKDKCNVLESVIGDTTPVGRYSPQGDSPYGVADMAGNVWEWTSSVYLPYPYRPDDGREDLEGSRSQVLRGGSFNYEEHDARCSSRINLDVGPDLGWYDIGFRVGWCAAL
jgi:formylglycine-generating enzyme required for sulfatase activity